MALTAFGDHFRQNAYRRYHPGQPGQAPDISNGYYDPNHDYGTGYKNQTAYQNTQWGEQKIKNNPEGYMDTLFASVPQDSSNPFRQFVDDKMQEMMRGFNAAQMGSPNLDLQKYMQGILANASPNPAQPAGGAVGYSGGKHGGNPFSPQDQALALATQQYYQQTAAQRGENPLAYGAGPARWSAY